MQDSRWNLCGDRVPKQEVVFICQLIATFCIVIVALINLSLDHSNRELWATVVGAGFGYRVRAYVVVAIMSRFTVTLSSNSSMIYSPQNTASEFTTKLNEFIELDGNWEVGSIEASFPADVENAPDNSFYYVVYFTDRHSSTVVLPRGVYGSVRVVLITLLAQQRKTLNLQGSNAKVILRKESVTNHITLKITRPPT